VTVASTPDNSTPVGGAVLAGGAGRRMGRPKAMVPAAGIPMARLVADALAAGGCHPVVVVGDDRSGVEALGLEIVPDRWPGQGPLGGVITALHAVAGDVVVAACDLPGLDASTVRAVVLAGDTCEPADRVDVAVAVDERGHAALARWNIDALERLERLFAEGERSLTAALAALRSVSVPCDPAALRNVNSPTDL
jgi:molybdenum cofactor guanylyltransferase